MIKTIEPKKLGGYLYRIGPYIYYYKSVTDDKNNSIIKNMDTLSNNYSHLNILQIEWENQIKFNSCTPENKKNTIFMYFRANLIKELFEPTFDEIQELFKEALEYHKERLQTFVTNQGRLISDDLRKIIHSDSKNITKKEKKKISNMKERKIRIIKKLIKVSNLDGQVTQNDSLLNLPQKMQNSKNSKKSIKHNNKTNFSIEKINKAKCIKQKINVCNRSSTILTKSNMKKNINQEFLHNESNSINKYYIPEKQKWFSNIKISSKLPNELLDEESSNNLSIIENKTI